MSRGVSHHTTMDASSVATLIRSILADHKFATSQEHHGQQVCIIGTTERSWLQVVLGAEPQQIVWSIEAEPAGARTTFTSRYSPWYARSVAVLSTVSLTLWYLATRALLDEGSVDPQTATGRLLLFVPAFGLLFLNARLLLADGGSRITRMLQALERTGLDRTHRFERSGSAAWSQATLYAGSYTIAIVVTGIFAVSRAQDLLTKPLPVVALLIALLLVAALAGVFMMCLTIPAASTRCVPMLPGLGVVVGFIILLAIVIPPFLAGQGSIERWADVVRRSGSRIAMLMALCTLVLMGMGFGMIIQAIRTCKEVVSEEAHVKSLSDTLHGRAVMAGSGFLFRLRFTLIVVWIALTVGLAAILVLILREVVLFSPSDAHVGAVMATRYVLAAAVGGNPDDPRIVLAMVLLWATFLVCAATPFILMVGEFVWSMLVMRRRMRAARSKQTASKRVAESIIGRLRGGAGEDAPRILVVPGCTAAASVAGFGRRDRVIVVGETCIAVLEPDELRALIAHELAHHIHRDCMRHAILRLLGRFTLVGDGFIAVLADSLQYEARADLTAVATLGVDPRHLASCLRKMAMLAAMERAIGTPGLPLLSSLDECEQRQDRIWSVIGRRLRLFWMCLTSDTKLGYWHPSIADRLARLEAMAARANERDDA